VIHDGRLFEEAVAEDAMTDMVAPGDRRIDRYRRLLAEWSRRAADRAETGTRAQRFARG
jgi:hypothetical protein